MRQQMNKAAVFLMIFMMLLGGTSTRVYAVEFISDDFEKDYTIGKLSALYYKDGKNKTFQVMVQEGKLYVNAQNLAEKLDFLFGVNDCEVQILLDDEWRGRRIANFEMNSERAWYYDGTEVVEYEMPFATIENEEGYWIPLRFAIKMMGAEMVLVGEEEIVLSDVGECMAYVDDDIYYSNTATEVCKFNSETGCVPMGIYSISFDFMDGTMYYANLNDGNTIYAYNELFGINKQVETIANCTFLNANGKQLYYKVDDNYNEGLVYALTPYVNTSRAVVYACYNPGTKGSFPSEYYQWNTSGCRIFNMANGTIYNEGALRCISPFTSYGFSVKNILMHFVYNISQKLA